VNTRGLSIRATKRSPRISPSSSPGHRTVRAYAVGVPLATALAIDAYVHATNAGIYDPAAGGLITEGNLFRAEAVVAGLVAILILLRPTRLVWALALGVASSALAAVVLYRYVDVGAIGPIPNLYEPTWQVPGKLTSAYAEGVGVLLGALGLVVSYTMPRQLNAQTSSL
jgi:hypothetical protein